MPKREITPSYIADHIRRVLKDGGSAPHSDDVQFFFKEVIRSRTNFSPAGFSKRR
jgi:hypothetical protein